ncbi:hypothetical protein T05_15490 [Trichinella murrelli]|uniref:Uncharacterized protein n=1 Tax=Trichinella murrelli TaxID=144512 RepID=A0A0V0TJZ8_9BILA|nr:hypothetical protein T05_15490 [Trichinella murrelli]
MITTRHTKVNVQCNGLSVKAGGSVTVLLFLVVSSPSELTLRQINDLQNEQKTIISNVYYAVLLTATTKNHNTSDSSPEPHNNVLTPSGSNVPPTVAECYGVVVHDQLGLS